MTPMEQAALFLSDYRREADARLVRRLATQRKSLDSLPFGIGRYHDLLPDYVARGGKRVRGALVLLGYEAAGGQELDRALEASLAFELLHAYLLAYDDFMDRDELRRGGKALHVASIDLARQLGAADPVQRGVSANLLVGMLMQTLAIRCVTSAGFPFEATARALDWLNEVLEGVTVGQLLDVCAADAPAATVTDIAEIHRRKTGLYTTEGPLLFGALLAGVTTDSSVAAALRGWAVPAGEAFQLVDDVLGIVGDPALTGKPSSGDLREGKRSSVLELALHRTTGADGDWLRGVVGHPLAEAAAARARALVESSGATTMIREQARALAADAVRAVDGRLAPGPERVLVGLASLFVERNA